MGFEKIIGQPRAVYLLAKSLADGRLHHACRLEGPDGTGKTMTAMALAASLNCLSPIEVALAAPFDGSREVVLRDFCGVCRQCRKIPVGGSYAGLTHPDVILVEPEGQSRIIKIEQIREIQSMVQYPPSEGRARVVVIRDVENISEGASNAFLKILEEPPPATYFMLTTGRPHRVLPTIRSRTMVVQFSPLAGPQVEAILTGLKPSAAAAEIALAASLSGGSVSRALSFLSEKRATSDSLKFLQEFDNNLMLSPQAILGVIDSPAVGKESIVDLIDLLGVYYRDVAWYGAAGSGDGIMLKPLAEQIAQRSRSLGPEAAALLSQRFFAGLRLLELNVSPKMILESVAFGFRTEKP